MCAWVGVLVCVWRLNIEDSTAHTVQYSTAHTDQYSTAHLTLEKGQNRGGPVMGLL